jgi:uncharacterized membrane protein YsdA (DUF1294 family)
MLIIQGYFLRIQETYMNWQIYVIWLAVVSVITFVLYGFDKALSKREGWRIPEVFLHGLALSGGFPGGWAGRALFHHKTRKGFFVFVLALSTMIHLGLGYWLIFGLPPTVDYALRFH